MIFRLRAITREQSQACESLVEHINELRQEFEVLTDRFPDSDMLKNPGSPRSWISLPSDAGDSTRQQKTVEDATHEHFVKLTQSLQNAKSEFGWPDGFTFSILHPAVHGPGLLEAMEKDKDLLTIIQKESLTWNFLRKLDALSKRRQELRA